ncbi:hypothetical protein ABG768_020675 [Culter alburnus]|uniref:Apolipoprotein L3 n=1 Tax=Culter alburnus TaxID=194366 RepID=A0AAW2AYX6_CULAL
MSQMTTELKRSIAELKSEFNRNHQTLTKLIKDLNDITDELESMHKNTTTGSLVGSSIGAAGGIASIAGLALAPFTFGASLVLTGVGAAAGVAGGVTGGASNITNAIKQKNLRETIEKIINDFLSTINPMFELLNKIGNITMKIEFLKKTLKQHEFQRAARGTEDILRIASLGEKCADAATEILANIKAVNAMRATAQASKTVRATAQASKTVRATSQASKSIRIFTGALSVVSLACDVYSIVQDSTELSEMNQPAHKRKAEEIRSETLKFILQVKETAAQFKISVDVIKYTIDTFESI